MADKKVTVAGLTDAGNSDLPNKPTEPAFKLGMNLNKIVFKCTDDRKPVKVDLKMFNPTSDTVSFKVRCTSAEIFRVQPPIGTLKPQSVADIVVWYHNSCKVENTSKNHYFAFYHMKAVEGKLLKDLWPNSKPDGVRRLPATFESTK